ncbi:MAG TPA: choice-of-anchor tandem repeat GloVer-containing protein, partial [Candidatus Cybelea sp.]
SGSEHMLHSFTGGSDGSYPTSTLAKDGRGTLYGTTEYGGSPANAGVVFAIEGQSGSERVLLAFNSAARGEYPIGGILVVNGALFGTASYGGSASAGIAFQL